MIENLAHEGDKWNVSNLRKQAKQLKIPKLILYGNPLSIVYIIRKVEQLSQIIDIIKPVYLDNYNTDEDEDYPKWNIIMSKN